ncbi:MAG: MaoC family dehydratase, partial [Candidatus Nanopelagicales bacterium]
MATVHPAQLGRFFEDYSVGDTYQHPFGRTISEADST